MVAFQVKAKNKILFKNGISTIGGIKRETLEYWLGLPILVFVVVVCLSRKKCYWVNVKEQNRQGQFKSESKTISLKLNEKLDFSEIGILAFKITYLRERM